MSPFLAPQVNWVAQVAEGYLSRRRRQEVLGGACPKRELESNRDLLWLCHTGRPNGQPVLPAEEAKIEANKSQGARAEVSVVSTQSFSGSYRVEFDSWFNYVGEINLGGAGSTEFGGGVVGNNGSDNGYAFCS